MKLKDEVGNRYGRWLVLEYVGRSKWQCRCDCGYIAKVFTSNLRADKSKSCRRCKRKTHGLSKTSPLFTRWIRIRQRTKNPNNPSFKNYGGRGILLCAEFENFEVFERYVTSTLGSCPKGKTLDRIDNNRGYEPGNLRWATRRQQQLNRRKSTHCTNGHLYDEKNTRVSRRGRTCRECSRATQARYNYKRLRALTR